ncbi:hypothetical protein OHD50_00155, partial [Escherichia coli]|nr:hypothetical protein [Escherichia coli]
IIQHGTDKAKSHCFTHLRYPYKRRYFIIGELVLWKISVYGRKDLTYLKNNELKKLICLFNFLARRLQLSRQQTTKREKQNELRITAH